MQTQVSFADSGSGRLYLVATPIGNLEDMTYRAVRILKEVAMIAAEDTRQTRKLLAHFQISNPLVSYHEHNKAKSGPELIQRLLAGQDIALVSDAGIPAISDPGYELVVEAAQRDIPVIPIPGANAALSALIVSGLPTDRFMFVGFLPRDRKKIHEELEKLKSLTCTLIIYEAPHRLVRSLQVMYEVWGDRKIALVRELTKKHETIMRGTISECLDDLAETPPRGEYCIVVGGTEAVHREEAEAWWKDMDLREHVDHYQAAGLAYKEAMRQTARDRGISRRDVYQALL